MNGSLVDIILIPIYVWNYDENSRESQGKNTGSYKIKCKS